MPRKKDEQHVPHGGHFDIKLGEAYRLICCDCSLVHTVKYKLVDGKIRTVIERDNRATQAQRRVGKNELLLGRDPIYEMRRKKP